MQKERNIFITGILGMLGSALALKLSQYFNIFGCDIVEERLLPKNIKMISLDLRNSIRAENYVLEKNIDVIIHCAACIDVDKCEREPDLATSINADVTKMLVKLAINAKAKLIYISTDAIFDGTKLGMYVETDPPSPINVYGQTKLLGENHIRGCLDNYTILRTNIYGWNLQNKVSFAEWVLNNLILSKPINMFTDVSFTPIYVGNLASAIKEVITKNITGTFNAVGSEKCSKFQFGQILADTFDIDGSIIEPISVDDFNFVAKRSKNMSLSSVKLQNKIGTKLLNIKDGLLMFKKDRDYYQQRKRL